MHWASRQWSSITYNITFIGLRQLGGFVSVSAYKHNETFVFTSVLCPQRDFKPHSLTLFHFMGLTLIYLRLRPTVDFCDHLTTFMHSYIVWQATRTLFGLRSSSQRVSNDFYFADVLLDSQTLSPTRLSGARATSIAEVRPSAEPVKLTQTVCPTVPKFLQGGGGKVPIVDSIFDPCSRLWWFVVSKWSDI